MDDKQLQNLLLEALEWEPEVDAAHIGVAAVTAWSRCPALFPAPRRRSRRNARHARQGSQRHRGGARRRRLLQVAASKFNAQTRLRCGRVSKRTCGHGRRRSCSRSIVGRYFLDGGYVEAQRGRPGKREGSATGTVQSATFLSVAFRASTDTPHSGRSPEQPRCRESKQDDVPHYLNLKNNARPTDVAPL